MASRPNYLFSSGDLSVLLTREYQGVEGRIQSIPKASLLNTPTEDLVERLATEFSVECPVLLDEEIHLDHGEARIDVSHDQMRYIRDRSQPFYLTGRYVEVIAPFTGDGRVFELRSSMFSSMPPRGDVKGQELRIRFEELDPDAAKFKRGIESELANVKKYLGWSANQIEDHNRRIVGVSRQRIEERRQRLLRDDEMVASLGFPLKKRDGAPKTYTLPVRRKAPVIRRPPTTEQPFKPEPELAKAEYEEILRIVQNMVVVMERSPSAFRNMGEEDLRQHFLVQLNGQYEGQATGETFNMGGKTDILIRADGRNVFIAECKFWTGPKGFHETIDQLLGYTSWRDTKTAILLFNRDRQLSTVLEKVPTVVAEHPNYKRTLNHTSETGFRFVLHQNGDENRDVTLTVLVFDVPAAIDQE